MVGRGRSALIDCPRGPRSVSDACCPLAPSVAFSRGSAWSIGSRSYCSRDRGFSLRATPLQTSCVYLHASVSKSSLTSAEEAADVCRICRACNESRSRLVFACGGSERERKGMRLTGPVNLRRRVEQSEMRPNPCRAKILWNSARKRLSRAGGTGAASGVCYLNGQRWRCCLARLSPSPRP